MNDHKEFLSGTLSGIILGLLSQNGRMYGYEICQLAKTLSGNEIELTEGALYPALHRLEKKGLLTSTKEKVNGRTRKYYSIKQESSQLAKEKINALISFSQQLHNILQPKG